MKLWALLIAIVVVVVFADILHKRSVSENIDTPVVGESKVARQADLKTESKVEIKGKPASPRSPASEASQGTVLQVSQFQELVSEKKPIPLSANIEAKIYPVREYAKLHPELNLNIGNTDQNVFPENAKKIEPSSKFPNERFLPFSQLNSDCAMIKTVTFPIVLRVNGNGNVTDAVPLFPMFTQDDIPQGLTNCKINGGGSDPFITTVDEAPPPGN